MGGQFDSICMHTLPFCGPLNGGRPGEIHILDRHFGQTAILFCVYVGFVLIRLPCGWIGASMCFLAGLSPLWWSRSMSVAEHPMFAELPFCWVGLNNFFLEKIWIFLVYHHFYSFLVPFSLLHHGTSLHSQLVKATVRQVDGITALSLARKASTAGGVRFDELVYFGMAKNITKKDGVLHTKVTKAWKMVNSSKFYVFMA